MVNHEQTSPLPASDTESCLSLSSDLDSSFCRGQEKTGSLSLKTIVPYPAPLPKFTDELEAALKSGNKTKVMLVYTEIVKEAKVFYAPMIPTDTARAKVSLANIGRTVIEKYPVLAVADRPNLWTHFNEKLSSQLRNSRNRVKHKLDMVPRPLKVAKVSPAMTDKKELTEADYIQHVAEVQKEMLKAQPDASHLKNLVISTHVNRRKWIDGSTSTDLRLSQVIDKFPCLSMPDMLLTELALMKGQECVDGFEGMFESLIAKLRTYFHKEDDHDDCTVLSLLELLQTTELQLTGTKGRAKGKSAKRSTASVFRIVKWEDCHILEKYMKTKPGEEPLLVLVLNEDGNLSNAYVCGDEAKICEASTVQNGLLYLIATYFLMNLNYPDKYAQILGFIQLHCLNIDFPSSMRSNGFTQLKESLA